MLLRNVQESHGDGSADAVCSPMSMAVDTIYSSPVDKICNGIQSEIMHLARSPDVDSLAKALSESVVSTLNING